MTRIERIKFLCRIASVVKRAASDLAAIELAQLPPELVHRLREAAESARIAETLAEKEIGYLEAARDWNGGDA
jgi:hypothetical protein